MEKEITHIARRSLSHCWEKDFEREKMVYLGAAAGWGKSTAAKEWLNRKRCSHQYISAKETNLAKKIIQSDKSYIVIDDLHVMTEEGRNSLLRVLETSKTKMRFLLIGRRRSCPWLQPFVQRREMVCYDEDALMFCQDEVEEYLQAASLPGNTETADHILFITRGYPLGVSLLIQELKRGRKKEDLGRDAYRSLLFQHYDTCFEDWKEERRQFALSLSFFPEFSLEMAETVCQCKNAAENVEQLMEYTGLVHKRSVRTYGYASYFRSFLEHIRGKYMIPEDVQALLSRGAMFYEKSGDLFQAMDIYRRSNDMEKLSSVLRKKINASSELIYDARMIPYYRALSKEQILSSPDLMAAESMVCSVLGDVDHSEYWYGALGTYLGERANGWRERQICQGYLIYLSIILPHRGSLHLASTIKKAFYLVSRGECIFPEVASSDRYPSLINGAKDLCRWVPLALQYYRFLKQPIEVLFKEGGVGWADIALGECYFERGDPVENSLLLLHRGRQAAVAYGAAETEFAAVGVLVRVMLSQDGFDSAVALAKRFLKKAEAEGKIALCHGAAALLARLALYRGDRKEILRWLMDDAPDENGIFYPLDHDRYLTKIRCYISLGREVEAMSLLSQFKGYVDACDRIYLSVKCNLLFAVLEYRMGRDGWQNHMKQALTTAEHYHLFRAVAEEGAAVLPLMQKMKLQTPFERNVFAETRRQAVYYPEYLTEIKSVAPSLTESEKNVLRLIMNGKSNEEISAVLHISVRTVKYHLTNIYRKLGVKNRSQAMMVANRNNFI